MSSDSFLPADSSSLLNLKAELHRKKQEAKVNRPIGIPSKLNSSKKFKHSKAKTAASSECALKKSSDDEGGDEHEQQLRKSRAVLEAKSRLYDKLKSDSQCAVTDDAIKNRFLVNFEQKSSQQQQSISSRDDDDDWYEYTDDLGRSRTALRKDIPRKYLTSSVPADASEKGPEDLPAVADQEASTAESSDWLTRRQAVWREQEEENLDKRDIHYQDMRFDEARTHGAGYFEFSRDATEREEQKQELLRMRDETSSQQMKIKSDKLKRQQKLQERLKKVRERKRLKLGLTIKDSLEEEPVETVPLQETNELDIDAKLTEIRQEEEQRRVEEERKKFVREWDMGKEGLLKKVSTGVLSQDEWISKQRAVRKAEFAPPTSYKSDNKVGDYRPPLLQREKPTLNPVSTAGENDSSHISITHSEQFPDLSKPPPDQSSSSTFHYPDTTRPPPKIVTSFQFSRHSDVGHLSSCESALSMASTSQSCRPDVESAVSSASTGRSGWMSESLHSAEYPGKTSVSEPAEDRTAAYSRCRSSAHIDSDDSDANQTNPVSALGVQIAPPLTAEYFGTIGHRRGVYEPATSAKISQDSRSSVQQAIEAGLESLRRKKSRESEKTPML